MRGASSTWEALFEAGGPRHATLIDPASTAPEDAGELATAMAKAGTDLFLVGGSTGVTAEGIQATVDALAEACQLPCLLFPSSHTQMASGLDGILFTLTLNSSLQPVIIEEPSKGAEPVLTSGLEAVTTAYVIVEPGMTVGRVTKADLVTRDQAGMARARRYAHLAEVIGLDAIYLEAGSGADAPVPVELIQAAASADVRVIVGGGIRTAEQARAAAEAGADLVVTGTAAERGNLEAVAGIIQALAEIRRA